MLSFSYRFHGYGSLKYVYKKGDIKRANFFTLKYVKNLQRDKSRISVVVSKKVHKSAVVRNRIRRRIYEVFRTRLPDVETPHDIVCIVTALGIKDLPQTELVDEINKALASAGVCKNT